MQIKNLIISIVTPSYNQGKFIAKTIESVLSQEGEFYIDYIIMDGYSSDNSVEVIKKYEKSLKETSKIEKVRGLDFYVKTDSEFSLNNCQGISYRWVSEKDRGQSDALNKGFKKANGEIVAWINSDDYYLKGAFSQVLRRFVDSGADVVLGDTIRQDVSGAELWRSSVPVPTIFSMLYRQNAPQQPGIFFTKDLIDKVEGVNESLHYVMDIDLWLKFLFNNAKFAKLDMFVAVQVYHDQAKSCQSDDIYEVFGPEDRMIKKAYKKKLGIKRYWYLLVLFKEKLARFIPSSFKLWVRQLLTKVV